MSLHFDKGSSHMAIELYIEYREMTSLYILTQLQYMESVCGTSDKGHSEIKDIIEKPL